VHGSATIKDVYDSATINSVYGGATINYVYGRATVTNAQIDMVAPKDNAVIIDRRTTPPTIITANTKAKKPKSKRKAHK
jgi:hypothetical protein